MKPGRKIYVDATYGSDGNAGTKANPMKTLAAGYSQLRTGRNDTMFLANGNYILTAEFDWTKSDTNVVGLCENIEGDHTQGGVNIYSTTVTVVNTIDLSGDRCLFQNVKITNAGAAAACLQAVFVRGAGALFKNVAISGSCAATQAATALATSLCIGRGGYFPRFEDCVIGNNTQVTRTGATNSHLHFTNLGGGTYPPDNGTFKRCKFLSISVAATTPMIYVLLNSLDRIWLFEDCTFYNFYVGAATKLNEVIHDDDTFYTHQIVLKRCTAVGYTEWQTSDIGFGSVQSDMPITGTGGGLTTPPTAAVGA